jgi:hypothetical protein
MRVLTFTLISFLLILPLTEGLETGTIFSADITKSYKCIYVNLPQDLGITEIDKETEAIIELDKTTSPWSEITYNKVVINQGVWNKNPVCFSYANKNEGDFSFYHIKISSPDLGLSKTIQGGFCISSYEDIDSDVSIENQTDVCELLSKNADIIDISFDEDIIQAKPGELLNKNVYVTSYANLKIKLSMITNLQNDFSETFVITSPSKPTVSKNFKIKVPEREGDFYINVLAEVEGCFLPMCKKIKQATISVKDKEKSDFSAVVVPKNINIKQKGEVIFKVIINNYEKGDKFKIEASSTPLLSIEPKSQEIEIEKNKEKSVVFKITPGEENLYEINFKISVDGKEMILTAYLSVGELLNDALRYSKKIENEIKDENFLEELKNAKFSYEESYNQSSSDDLLEYQNFINELEEIKKKSETKTEKENDKEKTNEEGGFNLMLIAIPLLIIFAVVLLFIAFKKAKTKEEDYIYQERYRTWIYR